MYKLSKNRVHWEDLWSYYDHHNDPKANQIFEKYADKITCFNCCNESTLYILEKYPDKVEWEYISRLPYAIKLIEKNLDKVDWESLSENPNAIHILEQNLDKVDWFYLSENPNAIHILEQNFDKIHWGRLSKNPNAVHLLEKKLEMIEAEDKAIYEAIENNEDCSHFEKKGIRIYRPNSDEDDSDVKKKL